MRSPTFTRAAAIVVLAATLPGWGGVLGRPGPLSMALLEVRDLALEYSSERGRLRAVDGISLTIREGHTVGVVGESGSGKTTLISLLVMTPLALEIGKRHAKEADAKS